MNNRAVYEISKRQEDSLWMWMFEAPMDRQYDLSLFLRSGGRWHDRKNCRTYTIYADWYQCIHSTRSVIQNNYGCRFQTLYIIGLFKGRDGWIISRSTKGEGMNTLQVMLGRYSGTGLSCWVSIVTTHAIRVRSQRSNKFSERDKIQIIQNWVDPQ